MELEVMYFILGVILGASIAMYFYESSKQKAYLAGEKFVSKKLKLALDNSSEIMYEKIKELKRDLTDTEKDEIIRECYERTNNTN